MRVRSQRSEVRGQKWLLLLLLACFAARAEDFASLCADRAAIERVYYNHRIGTRPPFAQVLPPATLKSLVRLDLKKEAILREHYGVTITPAMLQAEVRRINTSTRAPKMLAEIKAALGNHPEKFAEAFAKPFLVDRLLHEKFENDEALHAPQRRECERIRAGLLAAKAKGATPAQLLAQLRRAGSNAVREVTWQLTSRPAETNTSTAEQLEIKQRFGPQAQILSPARDAEADRKFYFKDLPGELQRVLRVQLRQPGDVSAVIETPGGFLLYVAVKKTDQVLTVGCLPLRKRDYEQWLKEQKVTS